MAVVSFFFFSSPPSNEVIDIFFMTNILLPVSSSSNLRDSLDVRVEHIKTEYCIGMQLNQSCF